MVIGASKPARIEEGRGQRPREEGRAAVQRIGVVRGGLLEGRRRNHREREIKHLINQLTTKGGRDNGLRQQSQTTEEEMHLLRRTELHHATEQSRQAAIARFYDGGELRRLLHPQTPTMHSPMLRTSVPDSFVVAGDGLSLQTVATDLQHVGGLNLVLHGGSILVTGIRPVDLLPSLRAVARAPRTVRLLPAGSRLAHSSTDRLSAWEHCLALEATARQAVCQGYLGTDVTPVTVATWCSRCLATTTLCVYAAA